MYCPNCGHDNPAGTRFCVNCGSAIPTSEQQEQSMGFRAQQASAAAQPSIFFMDYVLNRLSDGTFFRHAFVIAMNIGAILIAVGAGLVWLVTWSFVLELNEAVGAGGLVGGIFYQLFSLVFWYMFVHAILIRSREIARMEPSEFTLIPIASVLTRLVGDLSAIFWVFFGIAGGVLLWFAVPQFAGKISPLPPRTVTDAVAATFGSFVAGVVNIVQGLILAFVSLVFFYFLSESILVVAAIARNTEAIRRVAEQQYATTGQNAP